MGFSLVLKIRVSFLFCCWENAGISNGDGHSANGQSYGWAGELFLLLCSVFRQATSESMDFFYSASGFSFSYFIYFLSKVRVCPFPVSLWFLGVCEQISGVNGLKMQLVALRFALDHGCGV